MVESAPEKCVFTNHVSSAAPESEFDHANRIPCQKVGVVVYIMSRLSVRKMASEILYLHLTEIT